MHNKCNTNYHKSVCLMKNRLKETHPGEAYLYKTVMDNPEIVNWK